MWKLQVKDESNLCFMTQTTLSVDDTSDVIDALRQRFPSIIGPRKDDICYATTNRQEAVRNPPAMRTWCWWWGQKLLQLQPTGGTGAARRQTGLSYRFGGGYSGELAERGAPYRRYRRCLSAGRAGAGGDLA